MIEEYNYHSNIMGCDFELAFITDSVEKADDYFTEAFDIAQFYEKKFSRFDNESELSQLNKNKLLVVSREFLDVYHIACDLYQKTQKKFNPLMQVSKLGYNKTFDEIQRERVGAIDSQYNIDLDDVIVNKNEITLQDTQNLDFGGFLKGYVAQKITQKINKDNGTIINVGGDIYVSGLDTDNRPFEIEIINPDNEDKNIKVSILDRALCTSGTYKRNWKYGNNRKHHILDTAQKDSAKTDIISATVLHDNGAIADAYATLAVALGKQRAIEFLTKQNIDFVIICKNSDIMISDNIKQ